MTTETDLVLERRRTRRQSLLWKIVAVAAVTALLAVLAGADPQKLLAGGGPKALFDGEHVARLDVSGLILEDRWRDQLMRDLKGDAKVKAVVVTINSPGGTVVGGENLYLGLRAIAAEKPVVAVMGSTATSAAYMTAIGAERIFAREGSVTGSIGVIMQTADVTALMDKLGIKPEVVKSGPFKAQPNPLEPMSEEVRAQVQVVIMDMYDMFIAMVAERRAKSAEQTRALADGRVFTGRQALANGLIDALGGETEALDWLAAEKGVSRDLPLIEAKPDYPQPALVERLFGALTGGFGKALVSERLTLDGLLSVWHPGL